MEEGGLVASVRFVVDHAVRFPGAMTLRLDGQGLQETLSQKDHIWMLIEREVVRKMQDVDLNPSLTEGWERSVGHQTLCSGPLPCHFSTHAEPSCFPNVPGCVTIMDTVVSAPVE